MPYYTVTTYDAQGQLQSQVVEAISHDQAVAVAQARGLRIHSVTPMQATPTGSIPGAPSAAATALPGRDGPAARPTRSSTWVIVGFAVCGFLTAVAMGLAIAALVLGGARAPWEGALKRYDFKDPKNAYRSWLRIQAEGDVWAQIQLAREIQKPRFKERMKTLKIHARVDFEDKVILFVSYEEKGRKQHRCDAMEKDKETGYWSHSYVSRYTVGKSNPELGERMKKWEDSGQL